MTTTDNTPPQPTRVFYVDDHAVMRIGLMQLLSQRGFEICGDAGDPDAAFSGIERGRPEVVLVDLNLRGYDGIQLLHDLHQRWPKLPLVAYTMHDDAPYVERALAAGATGFVCKSEPTGVLLETIAAALRGERTLSPAAARGLSPSVAAQFKTDTATPATGNVENLELDPTVINGLPPRPRQVFGLLGEGYSVTEIATKLSLSRKTVETHCARLCETLGVSTQRELARLAVASRPFRSRTT